MCLLCLISRIGAGGDSRGGREGRNAIPVWIGLLEAELCIQVVGDHIAPGHLKIGMLCAKLAGQPQQRSHQPCCIASPALLRSSYQIEQSDAAIYQDA